MQCYADFQKTQRRGAVERIFGYAENETRLRMKPFASVFLILSATVCSAFIGAWDSTPLGIASLISSAIVILAFSKSLLSFAFLAIPSAIAWLYTGSFTVSMLFCAFVTAAGVGAFLLKTLRSPFLIALMPASFLLSFAVGGSLLKALLPARP